MKNNFANNNQNNQIALQKEVLHKRISETDNTHILNKLLFLLEMGEKAKDVEVLAINDTITKEYYEQLKKIDSFLKKIRETLGSFNNTDTDQSLKLLEEIIKNKEELKEIGSRL